MKKEHDPKVPTEKFVILLDSGLAGRLKACASIERRSVEEVVAEALQEYFERKKLRL